MFENLSESQEKAVREKLKRIPPSMRPAYILAMSGKSRKAADRAGCRECMGWTTNDCDNCACPHYPYRPAATPVSRRPPIKRGLASQERRGGAKPRGKTNETL